MKLISLTNSQGKLYMTSKKDLIEVTQKEFKEYHGTQGPF